MKKWILCAVFSAEAVLCAVFAAFARGGSGPSAGGMALPFEPLGVWLRALSLAGDAGNAAAVVLYAVIGLAPAAYLAVRAVRRNAHWEDALLVLLSAQLFAVLYLMINPADIARHFGAAELAAGSKVMLGATVWGTLAGYAVLRALRVIAHSGTEALLRHLNALLYVLCAILVYAIAGAGTVRLTDAFDQLNAGNTGTGGLSLSYLFLVLQFVVDSLPYALNLVILFSGLGLIEALAEGQYSAAAAPAARTTARLCRIAIVVMMLSQIAVNTLQLALGASVRAGHYTLSVPLLSVLFTLTAMLFAHYFEQARALKDDNDMII